MLFLNLLRSLVRSRCQASSRAGTPRYQLRIYSLRHTALMALSLDRFRTGFRMAYQVGQTCNYQRTTRGTIALSRCAPIIEMAGRQGLLPPEILGIPATQGNSAMREMAIGGSLVTRQTCEHMMRLA